MANRLDLGYYYTKNYNQGKICPMEKKLAEILTSALAETSYSFVVKAGVNPTVSSLVFDSRKVTPGALYFAWSGVHVHGNRYISKAIEKGASAVIFEEDEDALLPEEAKAAAKKAKVPLIKVPNARFAMSSLAADFYDHPSKKMVVIGVTGTEGKSTTVYLIWQILRSLGKKAGFISTVQYSLGGDAIDNPEHQTTPEATIIQERLYQMVSNGVEYAIVESSSHGLSKKTNRLGDVAFDVAVMMNVTSEHLEFHGTYEQYKSDKANLFRSLDEFSHTKTIKGEKVEVPSFGVVNGDDKAAEYFAECTKKPVFSFIKEEENASSEMENCFLMECLHSDERGEDFSIKDMGNNHLTDNIRINLPGTFNVFNGTAAAIVVSKLLNLSFEDLKDSLETLLPVKGRMTVVDCGQPFEVIVDYAHTPSSFETIFPPLKRRLKETTKGRLFVLFGSGGERDTKKRPEQGRIAEKYCDMIFLTDEDPRGEVPMDILEDIAAGCKKSVRGKNLFLIPDRPTAINTAFKMAKKGDIVLLLGKAHENSIIYKDHVMPYDEISEAKKQLQAIKEA